MSDRAAFLSAQARPWLGAAGLLAILILWEAVCTLGWVPRLFLPPPSDILADGWELLQSGVLLHHLATSLGRIFLGLALGWAAGVVVGVATGASRMAGAVGDPIVAAVFPIPKIALLPLLILWLGIGEASKVAVIALGGFFPMAINVQAGVKAIDPALIRAALSLGSSRFGVIRKVILPGILPMIFAGMRLGIGMGLLLVVAAEMIAADAGLGFMILSAADLLQTKRLMVGLLVLSALGIILNGLLTRLERRIIPWKH